MKKNVIIITSAIALIILIFWIVGVIPKQIGKIYGIKYMQYNFPEMKLEYMDIEWSKYHDNYIIKFEDKENQKYSCVIGPKYFPIAISQGLFEIQNAYQEKYLEEKLIKQKIAVATLVITPLNDKTYYSKDDIRLNNKLIATYRAVINSNSIQEKVKENYPNAGNIELETVGDTGMIQAIYVAIIIAKRNA